jgi:hypothetical protein
MQSLEQVMEHLGFHPATPETAAKYDAVRTAFVDLATNLWPLLPDGPDKTVAFRQLHLTQMLTIAAIAVNEAPADWVHPQIARVLPHGDVAVVNAPEVVVDPPLVSSVSTTPRRGHAFHEGARADAGQRDPGDCHAEHHGHDLRAVPGDDHPESTGRRAAPRRRAGARSRPDS